MTDKVPRPHPLNFYAVLGLVTSLLMMLGYTREKAHRSAVGRLARCKPRPGTEVDGA